MAFRDLFKRMKVVFCSDLLKGNIAPSFPPKTRADPTYILTKAIHEGTPDVQISIR